MPATARHQRLRRHDVSRWDQGAAVATGGITPVNLVWPKEDSRCGDGRSVSEAVQPIIGILVQADHG
jgi:hypothetical protein